VLHGPRALVGAVVLAFLWAATEWTAWQLGSQSSTWPQRTFVADIAREDQACGCRRRQGRVAAGRSAV
jgi:hypothetical protein